MSETTFDRQRARSLATFGADLSRWPSHQAGSARQALLADPAFRRAWEAERELDAALTGHRGRLDVVIEQSGAAERVGRRVLARLSAREIGLHWRKVAAAMVVAGALGGAMSLVLPEQPSDAVVDPLFTLDDTAL